MKILVQIIIILSTFYMLRFAVNYYLDKNKYDPEEPNIEVVNKMVNNDVQPNDNLNPNIIPYITEGAGLDHPDILPIDKLVEPEPKKIVIPSDIQPDIVKPSGCDITIGANRPHFKNDFEANYNQAGAELNMIKENNPVTSIKSMLNNDTNVLMSYNDDLYQNAYEDVDTTPQMIVNNPVFKPTNFPSAVDFNNKTYNFIGVAYNEYYNQYYLLYENIIKSSTLELPGDNLDYVNYKVAEYILAKMDDNKGLLISHIVGPRNKINYNEVVYFSFGNFQLGPLIIKQVN